MPNVRPAAVNVRRPAPGDVPRLLGRVDLRSRPARRGASRSASNDDRHDLPPCAGSAAPHPTIATTPARPAAAPTTARASSMLGIDVRDSRGWSRWPGSAVSGRHDDSGTEPSGLLDRGDGRGHGLVEGRGQRRRRHRDADRGHGRESSRSFAVPSSRRSRSRMAASSSGSAWSQPQMWSAPWVTSRRSSSAGDQGRRRSGRRGRLRPGRPRAPPRRRCRRGGVAGPAATGTGG